MAQATDLDRQRGIDAYRGTSFVPERRADEDIAGYLEEVASFERSLQLPLMNLAQCEFVRERTEWFAAEYAGRLSAVWAARARVMSPMITGPANFPVARNQKRMASEEKRSREFAEFIAAARRKASRDFASLEKQAEVEPADNRPSETSIVGDAQVVRNFGLDRVQIIFSGRPESATISSLKAEGWRWSPRSGAWQRKLTDAAVRSAKRIVEAA